MQIGCHGLVWTGTYDAAGIRHAARPGGDGTAGHGFLLIGGRDFPAPRQPGVAVA